jgi:Uma2 family endonuclease
MKTLPFVSVEEYLRSHYDPDCDYVDGEVLERNVGERNHSEMQREFILFFGTRRKQWNCFVYPEQRVQVSPTRFRVPDVCVYLGPKPTEQLFQTPPFICIEILSPKDRVTRMEQKIDDYFTFGVSHVWVIDPKTRRAWTYRKDGRSKVSDGVLRTEAPAFEVPLQEIFAGID